MSGGIHLLMTLTPIVTIPQDTTCLWSHARHTPPPILYSYDYKKSLNISKEAPDIPLVWNTLIGSPFTWLSTYLVNLHLHITSQEMFPGSMASIGIPKMCSLSTCVARPTIFITLCRLLSEPVFSARLKTHPKPQWGGDRGSLIHKRIPRVTIK